MVFLLNRIFAVRDKCYSEWIQKYSVNILQIFIMVYNRFLASISRTGQWRAWKTLLSVQTLTVQIPVHQFGKVLYLSSVSCLAFRNCFCLFWFGFYLQSCPSHSFPLWFICFVSPLPLLLLNCDLWEFETSLDSTDSAESTFISCHYWSLALSFSQFPSSNLLLPYSPAQEIRL